MKPWTKAHRREALRRMLELAAYLVGQGRYEEAQALANMYPAASSEARFRAALFDSRATDFGIVRIDREVRRVDRLARGQLVRVVSRETRGRRRVKVTSIRSVK